MRITLSKLVYLLFTWPVGISWIFNSWKFGVTLIIPLLFMFASARYLLYPSTKLPSPIIQTAWYGLQVLVTGAYSFFVLILAPVVFGAHIIGSDIFLVVGALISFVLVIVATTSYFNDKKPN